jgi:ribosomal protein L32
MAYIICEKCGKGYKLKEGESSDNFEECECGGKFRYIQTFGAHFDDELDPINEFNICPDCGNILDETKICEKCGFKPKRKRDIKK